MSNSPTTFGWPAVGGRSVSTPAVTAVCFVVLVLEGYDLVMFGTVVPSLLAYEAWGLTPERVGMLGALTVGGMTLGALAAAWLTHRVGRRRLVIAGVATFSAGMALAAITPSLALFALTRALVGLGAGVVMPTIAATLADIAVPERRSRVTALGFAGICVGGVIAGVCALQVVPTWGFRPMFAIGALMLVVALPLMLKLLPDAPAVSAAASGTDEIRVRRAFDDDRLLGTLMFWLATFACLMVTYGVSSWLPELMIRGGYGLGSGLAFLLVLQVGALVGSLLASGIADRFGSKTAVSLSFGAVVVALVGLSAGPPRAVSFVLVALTGFGTLGTQILLNAFAGSYYPMRLRSVGLGLMLGVGRVGGIMGPLYVGFLVGAGLGFQTNFIALAVPAVLGVIAIAVIRLRPVTASAPQVAAAESA